MLRTGVQNVLIFHSANCDNFYQSLETPHGTIDGDDLDFLDDASLESMDSSSEAAFAGLAKQSLGDTGAKALFSRFKDHSEELQHFVHMLLMEPALSSSLPQSGISAEPAKSHSGNSGKLIADFEAFLRSSDDSNIYWITGKPCASKSTLMMYLAHHEVLPQPKTTYSYRHLETSHNQLARPPAGKVW
jgi:hypothetical protein